MPSQAFLDTIARMTDNPPDRGNGIHEARENLDKASAALGLPDDVTYRVENAGEIPAEWSLAADCDTDHAIIYCHGGGYTTGSIISYRRLTAYLAKATGVDVLNTQYHLAPEHPFPTAVEDMFAVYEYQLAQGRPAEHLAIAGDSAGGGLAMATLLLIKRRGLPLPAAGIGLSAWLDLSCSGASMLTNKKRDPLANPGGLKMMAAAYLGDTDPREPLASPLFAEDLAGLPPLLLQVGSAETLLDDTLRFCEKARAAGVDVSLEQWDDMVHVWHSLAPEVPEANAALADVGQWLNKIWG